MGAPGHLRLRTGRASAALRAYEEHGRIAYEHRLGVINGTEGEFVAVDVQNRTFVIRDELSGLLISLDRLYLDERLEDGGPAVRLTYCKTAHAIQGDTLRHETYTFARSESPSPEGLFVDLTRGRTGNYIFFAGPHQGEHDFHMAAQDRTQPRQRLLATMT